MFKPLKWVENNLFYSSHPSRATFNFPSTAGLLGHLYHYQISTRSLVSFLHWQGVSPCGKQVCHHAAAGQGKPREKQASQDHLRAQHHNSCFHVWFPNALKSELKRKQSCHMALFWHCYESAATWKLYIYCRDLFYVEKKKKNTVVIENVLTYTLWVCSCVLPLAFTSGCGRRQDIGLDGLTQRVSLMYLPLTAAKLQEVSWKLLAAEEW